MIIIEDAFIQHMHEMRSVRQLSRESIRKVEYTFVTKDYANRVIDFLEIGELNDGSFYAWTYGVDGDDDFDSYNNVLLSDDINEIIATWMPHSYYKGDN